MSNIIIAMLWFVGTFLGVLWLLLKLFPRKSSPD